MSTTTALVTGATVATATKAVKDVQSTITAKVATDKSSGRSFSWITAGFSFNQRVSITPLLITGVAAMVVGTAVEVFLHANFVGLCLKVAGLGCMVIAAYTQDSMTEQEKVAAQASSWKRKLDRVLIVTGIIATIASMVTAIFISSSWLLVCSALTGLALIRMQSFASKMDPVNEFTKQNKKLESQVGKLKKVTSEQDKQLKSLESLSSSQKAQLESLESENEDYRQHNQTLEVRIGSLNTSIQDLDAKNQIATGNNTALRELHAQYDELRGKISEEQAKLAAVQGQYQVTAKLLQEVSTQLQQHTTTYGSHNDRLGNSLNTLSEYITVATTPGGNRTAGGTGLPSGNSSTTNPLGNPLNQEVDLYT